MMNSRVLYNKNILPSYYKLGLEIDGGFPDCQAGQFVMLKISEQLDPLLRRPFGIYKNRVQGGCPLGAGSRVQGIEILYKVVGKGTWIMSGLKEGDKIDVLGPLGNSFPLSDGYKNIIMVAGGIGIVPFYMQVASCKMQVATCKILFGGRNKNDLPGLNDFKKLGVDISISTDDGSTGGKGFVTELLKEELEKKGSRGQGVKGSNNTLVLACGSKPMLKAVAEIADKKNIPCYVSLDNVMACGMGACLGCAVKVKGSRVQGFKSSRNNLQLYKMVCKDGPVFDSREIDWEKI
ncbi:MAG: dihydroorotate dehydrogenase electron transfer subunit [Deltaproteobacteria bacterium]|nr:dihydroorotate dehydrogenase electron transfer subunit [Deltaproteobacteria bacterium]